MSKFLVIAASSSIGTAVVKTVENQGHEVFTTSRMLAFSNACFESLIQSFTKALFST